MNTLRVIRSTMMSTVCLALMACSFAAAAETAKPETHKAQRPAHADMAPQSATVNLNTADVQTLAQLNGVGQKKAEAIIAYRQSNGGFKSVDELANVKGIGAKIVEKNRSKLSI